MKRLWIALGLLCFCLVLSVGALLWQRTTVKGLQEKLNMIDSTESATVFFDACTDAGEILALFGPHANSEDLLQSAATLPILLAKNDTVTADAEKAKCALILEELYRAELPILGNIL